MGHLVCLLLLCLFSSSCARQSQEAPYVRKSAWQKKEPKETSRIIVLDPGHGGKNQGTKMAIEPFTKEKVLTLQTAIKVRDLLQQWGYTVRMTRTQDVSVPLAKRMSFAKSVKGTIFVSLHYNHASNKQASGVEIFYYQKRNDAAQSKKLGQDILNAMVKHAKVNGRGVHAGDYHVIRENSMPAVLVEGGFFSNPQEAKKLSTPAYVNKLAFAIATGIDTYMQSLK